MKRQGVLRAGVNSTITWSRNGHKTGSVSFESKGGEVVFSYSHRELGDDEWIDEKYPVRLSWSACNLGGDRPWFICPIQGCGRRVAILHLSSRHFACRHCNKLAYSSQRETNGERQRRRADRIREKLKWPPGILNPNGQRPKGMHRKTFKRLSGQHDALVNRSIVGMIQQWQLKPIFSLSEC